MVLLNYTEHPQPYRISSYKCRVFHSSCYLRLFGKRKRQSFQISYEYFFFFWNKRRGCLSEEIVFWFSRLVKLFSRTCLHWKCLRHNDIEICNPVCLQEFNVYWYYIAKSWKILNYIKRTLFDCLNRLAHFYWKWLIIIKSIMHFFPKMDVLFAAILVNVLWY